MERRNTKKWTNELKVAIINNDLEQIKHISKREVPSFSSIQEAKVAMHWIAKARDVLIGEKNKIGTILKEIKRNTKYTNTNQTSTTSWVV